jgi:hypothetical protein
MQHKFKYHSLVVLINNSFYTVIITSILYEIDTPSLGAIVLVNVKVLIHYHLVVHINVKYIIMLEYFGIVK